MNTAVAAPTPTDHDLVMDVAHTAGLAITEQSGSLAPVMAHGPSTHVTDADTVRTTLFLPHGITDAELRAVRTTLTDNGATIIEAERNDMGRWLAMIEVARGPYARDKWERAASRHITPGSGDTMTTVTVHGRPVRIDLDGPFIDIVDALWEAGMDSDRASDYAWRLVQ